jgi:hypothetical protein
MVVKSCGTSGRLYYCTALPCTGKLIDERRVCVNVARWRGSAWLCAIEFQDYRSSRCLLFTIVVSWNETINERIIERLMRRRSNAFFILAPVLCRGSSSFTVLVSQLLKNKKRYRHNGVRCLIVDCERGTSSRNSVVSYYKACV